MKHNSTVARHVPKLDQSSVFKAKSFRYRAIKIRLNKYPIAIEEINNPLSVGDMLNASCKYNTMINARAPKVMRLIALLKTQPISSNFK